MKKRILCLMTALLLFVSPMSVYAETYHGDDDWYVYFNGKEMIENFTDEEMTETVKGMQPGDDIYLQVHLENKYKETTDWYMTNEVIRTLEESVKVAEGGAYSYLLKYYDVNGKEQVIYDSEVVGGEEDTSKEGLGLHQATNALEEYYYLDRIKEGETGLVTLYVKLEGETQGNDYQDTLAQLKLNFAVELVETGANEDSYEDEQVIVKYIEEPAYVSGVKTGDPSSAIKFSLLALVSGLGFAVTALLLMKKNKQEKGEKE